MVESPSLPAAELPSADCQMRSIHIIDQALIDTKIVDYFEVLVEDMDEADLAAESEPVAAQSGLNQVEPNQLVEPLVINFVPLPEDELLTEPFNIETLAVPSEPNQLAEPLVINVVPLAQPSQPTANQPTAEEVKAAKDYMIKRYAKNGVLCTISEPEIKKVLETDKLFKNHWEVLMEDRRTRVPALSDDAHEQAIIRTMRTNARRAASRQLSEPGKKPIKVHSHGVPPGSH